jgi:hypothetical protein
VEAIRPNEIDNRTNVDAPLAASKEDSQYDGGGRRMKCKDCKEEILQYGRTTENYWGSCDCKDWKLVQVVE